VLSYLLGLWVIHNLYGVGTPGFELIYLMGTAAILSILGPRIYERAKKLGVSTPTQLIYTGNGSRIARYLASVSYLIFMITYMSVQVIGPAVILSRFGIPKDVAIVLTLATVFLYILR
jgi:Na+/proline symporter